MPARSDRFRTTFLRSCILAGGLGLLTLSCDAREQTTAPNTAVPSLAVSVSSSNFQQCGNGDNGGQPCVYINGVLNNSKSLYHESDVIAERFDR